MEKLYPPRPRNVLARPCISMICIPLVMPAVTKNKKTCELARFAKLPCSEPSRVSIVYPYYIIMY